MALASMNWARIHVGVPQGLKVTVVRVRSTSVSLTHAGIMALALTTLTTTLVYAVMPSLVMTVNFLW